MINTTLTSIMLVILYGSILSKKKVILTEIELTIVML